ncbi:hypothetical protein M8818_007183 [Zalaria obscura]|uniref:Uncharacterized protein n=1 Tax=Zalaria obscura TaxID=2024903 RepID=A0ACC3S635_9PEZI
MAVSSWLSHALPSYPRSLSPEQSRHPNWRTPSPMAASIVPPPIVSSVYLSSPRQPSSQTSPAMPTSLALFRRKQQQLEGDLQILLDAQAEALVVGAESNIEDQASTGSSTPTIQSLSLRARSRTPVRKLVKLSLRSARRAIHTTIRKLALLKAQEAQYLDPDVEECAAVLEQIEAWERKRHALEQGTNKIKSGQRSEKVIRLRNEADNLQHEINDVEARLAELKQQQRRLRKEAEEVENMVQAKLSSYTTSLSTLEADVTRFLQNAKPGRRSADARYSAEDGAEHDTFWQLPPNRRTLEMAKDTWAAERDMLVRKQNEVESEQEALQDGALVWKDVVKEVTEFETKLRGEMAALSKDHAEREEKRQGSSEEDGTLNDGQNETSSGIDRVLALLDQTTGQLQSQLKLAESHNWRLLMCAIGAELDAFQKGRLVLEEALGIGRPDGDEPSTSAFLTSAKDPDSCAVTSRDATSKDNNSDDEIQDLDNAFDGRRHENGTSDPETDDDGPDPELLISHQDTDTE